ncbi:ester cyclase [Kribbella soli]|uniref:Ester cyclase n=1 Tax=Kribbella soli TaxID=1124743 RepID=A0A4R0HEH3_9ACTN|nr:ester cyclase [Kribbella soli]TCC07760.1 ester cyclase [Kribbella soli]
MERGDLEEFYRRYLQRCNEYRFEGLGEFIDDRVEVNGAPHDVRRYAAGLRNVVQEYPDFHWDLRHLLIDGGWLSAHLIDTYTAPAGRSVSLQELAMYHVKDGRIVQVWGDLDHARLAR